MSTGRSGPRFNYDDVQPPRDIKFTVKGTGAVVLAECLKRTKEAFPEYSKYRTANNRPAFEIEMVDHYRRKDGTHVFHYRGSWIVFTH